MADSSDDTTVLALTAKVVAAHIAHNPVGPDALPGLIRTVFEALTSLGPEPPRAETPTPAVPPEQSVFDDHIICLEDGNKQKTLKRHLKSAHGMTPEEYRTRWGLGSNYPMVAPAYAKRRSVLAKESGLGTRRGLAD